MPFLSSWRIANILHVLLATIGVLNRKIPFILTFCLLEDRGRRHRPRTRTPPRPHPHPPLFHSRPLKNFKSKNLTFLVYINDTIIILGDGLTRLLLGWGKSALMLLDFPGLN
jgi:hypothetical protein